MSKFLYYLTKLSTCSTNYWGRAKTNYHLLKSTKLKNNSILSTLSNSNEIKNTIDKVLRREAELQRRLYAPEKFTHVDLTDNPNADSIVKGKFYKRFFSIEDNIIKIREATTNEVEESNNLALGGIGFDSARHLSALLKFSTTLANPDNKINKNYQPIAYFTEINRQERYNDADKYSSDNKYYSPVARKLVEKFLIPKLVHEEIEKLPDGSLHKEITVFDIPINISLISFSIGGREIMMMENALRDILKNKYSLNDELIKKLFLNFKAVCVGYAFDPGYLPEFGFSKLIIFSEDDRAVLIPSELELAILASKSSDNKDFTIYNLSRSKGVDYDMHLIKLHHGLIPIPNQLEEDTLDHTLAGYRDAIKLLPDDVQDLIGDYLCFDSMNHFK